jgi:pyruvate/2-oxoglutarate dehydrogenase complex dihydrolipoamide acyltransferase (E2) component
VKEIFLKVGDKIKQGSPILMLDIVESDKKSEVKESPKETKKEEAIKLPCLNLLVQRQSLLKKLSHSKRQRLLAIVWLWRPIKIRTRALRSENLRVSWVLI